MCVTVNSIGGKVEPQVASRSVMKTLSRDTWSNTTSAINDHAMVLPRERVHASSTDAGRARVMASTSALRTKPASSNKGRSPHGSMPSAAKPPPSMATAPALSNNDGFTQLTSPTAIKGKTITAATESSGSPTQAACNVASACAATTHKGVAAATATPRRSQTIESREVPHRRARQ